MLEFHAGGKSLHDGTRGNPCWNLSFSLELPLKSHLLASDENHLDAHDDFGEAVLDAHLGLRRRLQHTQYEDAQMRPGHQRQPELPQVPLLQGLEFLRENNFFYEKFLISRENFSFLRENGGVKKIKNP